MSLANRSKHKTEHSGAKNGGGYWGTREEAKKISKKHRRENSKKLIDEETVSVGMETDFQDSVLPIVNRSLMVVKAKQPFIDWINTLPKERSNVDFEWTLEKFNADPVCFLLPSDCDVDDALEHFLPYILHELFVSISKDRNQWPNKFSLKNFQKWFELEKYYILQDLPNREPIGYED